VVRLARRVFLKTQGGRVPEAFPPALEQILGVQDGSGETKPPEWGSWWRNVVIAQLLK